jgi:DNA-binding SARP family transcriptional activator
MTTLSLSYLGPFQASLGKQEAHKFRSSKAQALLVYLTTEDAMHSIPQSHRREALMDLLWPGLPLKSSQVNLRQILYRLRQAIPGVKAKHSEEAVPLLISDRQSVQINPEADIELDQHRKSLSTQSNCIAMISSLIFTFRTVKSSKIGLYPYEHISVKRCSKHWKT